ncbi:MAG: circularly permuted type 2 ATP-grasp protein, partial [Pseudomonadota bacterium]
MSPEPAPLPTALSRLLAAYGPTPGIADEMIDVGGQIRPVWRPFLETFAALEPDDIALRIARGDQYLRDAGVYYRGSDGDGPAERDWPLSHVPVHIAAAEWRTIAAAIAERAEVLEAVAADLYGPGTLVREGLLPAELVAQNPAWLRPLVGHPPPGGHFLNFCAFEIGRSPDGSWFVLGDRTEAPSGAGFALETRVATMRSFAEPFRHEHVHRVSGFFDAFRQALNAARPSAGRAAILTPGPGAETYFEH